MKTIININNWKRKDHFNFFSSFREPFWGITQDLDCTELYHYCKKNQLNFYSSYLYLILCSVNQTEEFKMRYSKEDVYIYDKISVSPTVLRPDGSFGFSYVDYIADYNIFAQRILSETEKVRLSSGLNLGMYRDDVVHFSALPWFSFTSVSHARALDHIDSCPKISVGKMSVSDNKKTIPISIHVNHALVDGYHMNLFMANLMDYFMQPEIILT